MSASSSFTPKVNNLSGSAFTRRDLSDPMEAMATTWDPWCVGDDFTPFSIKEEPTNLSNKATFEDLKLGFDNLERSLSTREDAEMEWSERLSSLAGETIQMDVSVGGSNPYEVESVASARGLCFVEELQRRLKVANDRVNAKDDACDLIYCQWQKTQKELDEKSKSESALLVRLAQMEKRLKDKENLIDDLQFRLFMTESDLEQKQLEEKAVLIRESELRRAIQSPSTKENIEGRVPFEALKSSNGTAAIAPCHSAQPLKVGNNGTSSKVDEKSKKSSAKAKRGFFAGLYKTKKTTKK